MSGAPADPPGGSAIATVAAVRVLAVAVVAALRNALDSAAAARNNSVRHPVTTGIATPEIAQETVPGIAQGTVPGIALGTAPGIVIGSTLGALATTAVRNRRPLALAIYPDPAATTIASVGATCHRPPADQS